MEEATLVLEDGSVFYGFSLGTLGMVCGEMVFNTAMTRYQEILTDPFYAHQIIHFTNPELGNVGVNQADAESTKIQAAGLVVLQASSIASNWRAEHSFLDYLKSNKVIGIADIDTRYLTHRL